MSGLMPYEGLGLGVRCCHVVFDCSNQFRGALETSPTGSFLGEVAEPPLHQVQPERTRWRKVQRETRVLLQPYLHPGLFVSPIIVHNPLHLLGGIRHRTASAGQNRGDSFGTTLQEALTPKDDGGTADARLSCDPGIGQTVSGKESDLRPEGNALVSISHCLTHAKLLVRHKTGLTFNTNKFTIHTYVWKYRCPEGEITMKRKMTVVFNDEDLYTQLKIEAVKRHIAASDIISDAVREWLESREDAELLPLIETSRKGWKENGGRPWSEIEKETEQAIDSREGTIEAKRV